MRRRESKNGMNSNGLPQHPSGNTKSIDVPLPHLEVRIEKYGKAESAILSLDDLKVFIEDTICTGRPLDHSYDLLIHTKLNNAIPHGQPVKAVTNSDCRSPTLSIYWDGIAT
jgi:hypothetical protein